MRVKEVTGWQIWHNAFNVEGRKESSGDEDYTVTLL